MKFIVSSTTLVKSLQMMSGVLSSSNVLPILDNFLFDLQDGALSISASDLETTINIRVPVKTDSTGNIAIPAKMLLDIIKTFPEMPLAFQVDTANYGIEISAGDGKYRLTGFDGIEFPRIQAIADGKTVKLGAQTLSMGHCENPVCHRKRRPASNHERRIFSVGFRQPHFRGHRCP